MEPSSSSSVAAELLLDTHDHEHADHQLFESLEDSAVRPATQAAGRQQLPLAPGATTFLAPAPFQLIPPQAERASGALQLNQREQHLQLTNTAQRQLFGGASSLLAAHGSRAPFGAPGGPLAQFGAAPAAPTSAQAYASSSLSDARARTEAWLSSSASPPLQHPAASNTTRRAADALYLQQQQQQQLQQRRDSMEVTSAAPTTAAASAPRGGSGAGALEPDPQQQQHQQHQQSPSPDAATMASLLTLPPEQQQMLVQLGVLDATALAAVPLSQHHHHQPPSSSQLHLSPPTSSSHVALPATAAADPAAPAASLDAAEALWQQAVNSGADDQTLLVLAAQLGLISTDASGQAVLTRDLLQQQQQPAFAPAPPPASTGSFALGPAAAATGVVLSSPTNLMAPGGAGGGFAPAQLPRLGAGAAPPPPQQSLEALLSGVQSAGMLGQLLATLGLAGMGGGSSSGRGGGGAAGKHPLGSPGPSKQHALYKVRRGRWISAPRTRAGVLFFSVAQLPRRCTTDRRGGPLVAARVTACADGAVPRLARERHVPLRRQVPGARARTGAPLCTQTSSTEQRFPQPAPPQLSYSTRHRRVGA